LLIERGADIHVKDSRNNTPLLYATEKNNTEICLLLIERGADIHMKDTYYNHTPLLLATRDKIILKFNSFTHSFVHKRTMGP